MIQARHGFRGVRVGEASHLGPPRRPALTIQTTNRSSLFPTWGDVGGTEGHGGRSVRARIGDVASPVTSALSCLFP